MTDMAATPLRLVFEVTPADYEAFNLHVAFGPRLRARWRWQFAVIYGGAAALLVGANLFIFGTARFDLVDHLLVPVLIVAGAAAVVTPLAYLAHRWNVRRVVRVMLGHAPREEYLGRKELTATPEGLVEAGKVSRAEYGWAAVTGVEESASVLLVMLGQTKAIIIPKRDLDAATESSLREALHRGIASAGGASAASFHQSVA